MTVTPEAAGSSPVDPANYLQVNSLHCSAAGKGPRPTAVGLFTANARARELHEILPSRHEREHATIPFLQKIVPDSY